MPSHNWAQNSRASRGICKSLYYWQSDSLCFHLSLNELKKKHHSFQLVKKQSFSHITLKHSRHLSWEDMKLNTFNLSKTGALERRIPLVLYSFGVLECWLLAYFFFSFIIYMCIQGLGHFSPRAPPPSLPPSPLPPPPPHPKVKICQSKNIFSLLSLHITIKKRTSHLLCFQVFFGGGTGSRIYSLMS
jgi:hypothetical protein